MTKRDTTRSTLFISAVLALGALGFSSLSAHADATSQLSQCRGFSAENVARCCDVIVKNQGTPMWMRDNHDTCHTSTSCSAGKYGREGGRRKLCYIQIKFDNYQGDTKNPPSRNQRSQKD